jgi:hypothetical protein
LCIWKVVTWGSGIPPAALLASAPWWEIGTARAQQIFIVCHGEFESTCKQHPYTVFERCGSDNGVGGANPDLSYANVSIVQRRVVFDMSYGGIWRLSWDGQLSWSI